jgi:hypothetical protein
MNESHSTIFLKRLAIVCVTVTALYFVYVAGYDHGARDTAAIFRAEVAR